MIALKYIDFMTHLFFFLNKPLHHSIYYYQINKIVTQSEFGPGASPACVVGFFMLLCESICMQMSSFFAKY